MVIRLLVLSAGLVIVGALADVPTSLVPASAGVSLLPNPRLLRVLGRSQLEFVADLFWVRMANLAGVARSPEEYGGLLPLGNLIADLSPRFKYSYYVGGVLAPSRNHRYEPWQHVEGAVALLERGMDAVPEYLPLPIQKGYLELELLHDPVAASATLRRAAKVPGAPSFLASLATRLLSQAGRFDDAREFAQSMAQSDDPQIRQDFQLRLRQIDLERVLTEVDAAAARFVSERGRTAGSVEELVREGYLASSPIDPFGGAIELSPDGARSSIEARRLRAFVAPE